MNGEPEVGEAVGEAVLLRHIGLVELATTHNKCVRMCGECFRKSRQVGGIMLTIGIHRDGIAETFLHGSMETRGQRLPLAHVDGVGDNRNAIL